MVDVFWTSYVPSIYVPCPRCQFLLKPFWAIVTEMFYKKGALKNVARFTRKHLCGSLFFNEVTTVRSATLLKKRLWHRRFPVISEKFLRTPILKNICKQLLLPFLYALIASENFGVFWCFHGVIKRNIGRI